jgi:polysaccharide biosynthesis/export protein
MLAAALLCGCGASSVSEFGAATPHLAASADAGAPAGGASASTILSPGQQAAVRKAAFTATSASDPSSKAYKVGPLDVLEVTVFKVPDLSKSIQVSEAGTINFPLVGEIAAGGKTAREIEQELTKVLGARYLQHPQVTVFVKEYNSQRITIEGAVKKPGVIPMAGGLTLLQAIAQAHGLESVAETTVVVFRANGGKRTAVRYDITSIREGKSDDPQLLAGDVIVVTTSDIKEGINTLVKFLPLATIIPLL